MFTLVSDCRFKIRSFFEFISDSSRVDSTMTTRNQGSGALKRNREAVKEILQENIDTGQTIIDNPKEGNKYKTWPLRQTKSNLIQFKESYETLFNQVLESLEKEATVAGRTEKEVQVLLDKEHGESFPVLVQARQMISTLTALKEVIDEEQTRNDRLQEIERERNDRLQEKEQARKDHLQEREHEREDRLRKEEEDRKLKTRQLDLDSQSQKEENQHKFALEKKRLELQEIAEKKKADLEIERLQVVRDTGGQVDLDGSRRSTDSSGNRVSAKLPQLEIPKFRGDKLKWIEFDSIFKATIDSNDNVSDVEKFSYLRTLLQGDAEGVIRGFPLSAEGYQAAYKLLEEKYGDAQVISDTLVAQICSLRSPSDSVRELRSFYDAIEGNLRALEARGEDVTGNTTLRLMIQEKLPKTVRVNLEMFKDRTQAWTLPLLRRDLLTHIQHRENVEGVMALTESREDSRSSRYGTQGAQRSSAQNLMTGSDSRRFNNLKCKFCKGKHFPTECTEFPDLQSRIWEAYNSYLCCHCLNKGHKNEDCYGKDKKCWYCEKSGHHQALCPKEFGQNTGQSGREPERQENDTSPERQRQEADKPVCNYGCDETQYPFSALGNSSKAGKPCMEYLSPWKKEVFFQTAWTIVRKPGFVAGSQTTRMILDCASDRSYISTEMADKLGLEPLSTEMLSIQKVHQQSKALNFESPIVELEIKLKDDTYMKIYASVINPVVGRFRRFPVDMKKWGSFFPQGTNLREKELSDALPVQREWCSADILIGGNYYEEIVLDKKTPIGDSGLFLRSSKLGEILTGAQEPKQLPMGSAYYLPVKPRSFAALIEEGEAARIESFGYFNCSHVIETEFTEIQRKLKPIGSQWITGTKSESKDGHWNKAVRRTPKGRFRQKSPSPRKGENRKKPKPNDKRILEVIPSSGLDTVCGAQKKKGREKTSFPPYYKPQQKKSRSIKEDQLDKGQWNNGFNQWCNGRKNQWISQKKNEVDAKI